jgi:hypothetical protein
MRGSCTKLHCYLKFWISTSDTEVAFSFRNSKVQRTVRVQEIATMTLPSSTYPPFSNRKSASISGIWNDHIALLSETSSIIQGNLSLIRVLLRMTTGSLKHSFREKHTYSSKALIYLNIFIENSFTENFHQLLLMRNVIFNYHIFWFLAVERRLAPNFWPSYLYLPSAGITGMHQLPHLTLTFTSLPALSFPHLLPPVNLSHLTLNTFKGDIICVGGKNK